MKKWTTLWTIIAMLGITVPAMGAMSINKMRKNTRFLTDRMAYELKLSPRQYDDVYEVNYDFINNVRYLMDDVVRGYDYALDRYYDFLDVRNDDLRWILSSRQYRRFMEAEHFYRPIYAQNNKWRFRIYLVYNNVNFFYYGKPHHYATYCGGHYRTHFNNVSYYRNHHRDHYRHEVYDGHFRIRHNQVTYDRHRRRDFNVAIRPSRQENHRPVSPQMRPQRPAKDNHRPSVSPVRPDKPKKETGNKRYEHPSKRENSHIKRDKHENKRTDGPYTPRNKRNEKSKDRGNVRVRTV